MLRALPHILSRVFGPPLLIAPVPLDALLAGLHAAMRARGSQVEETTFNLPDFRAAFDTDRPPPSSENDRPRGYRIDNRVATVPVHGVLVRRAGQIAPDSTPLQSYESVGRILRAAQADNRVGGVLLDIDSPGGEAGGVFDLARVIRQAGQLKPIWAMANDDALSAAYVLASAADRIWSTQTAALGSLGVVALHADQSAFDAAEGIKYTYLYRGARKIDANPHGPLSDEGQQAIQGEVDRLYDKLVDIVAEHRGITPGRIRNQEAAVYFGENATGAGLVDQIGTFEQAHAAFAQHIANPQQPRGPKMEAPNPPTGEQPNPPATPPTPPAATPPADNVVQLRVDEAVTTTRAQAREIAELCALARYPEMAAGFIGEGLGLDVVRQRLLARQAEDNSKRQLTTIDPSSQRSPRLGGAGGPATADLERAAQARFRAQRGVKE
jgi:signal peptide peptidase SppA